MHHMLALLAALPTIIDFSPFPATSYPDYPSKDCQEAWKWEIYAFNCAPEVALFFSYLQREYKIDTAIETGTYNGSTTEILSLFFKTVHKMQLDPGLYESSKKRLGNLESIQFHLGNSPEILPTILPSLNGKRLFFYLDAHGNSDYWPLLDELEEISRTHRDNCIIAIDDFQVPGRRDIPYDSYGNNSCSLGYIEQKLNKIFSSYTVHYIIPKSVLSKAKLVVLPRNWKTE